ncbi:hypothetical protein [uncultured Flavobacterium sp.]|jgi:DNA-directed RNA polymerase subunit RPC12/RpoP|uniref:hypothetical protein n=1 Tax=uncultured Flavobacterium sp. TaxID=165435 RepID=UPI0012118669|nr:hypothetical protein [uncultured Flavobacterium sp.]THD33283.1 MAG: hypothetical protein DI588_04925 [Flavobacterium johnsoniae]
MKKFFLNFKKARCKNCGQMQNYFRIPKNWRQFLWGGYSCGKCGAELDKFGEIIKMPKEFDTME